MDTEIHRSGFIAIAGKPNTGKSTLVNWLLGQPVAGVSAKPQTTRKRQLAILTSPDAQLIFVDTPGLHEAKDKLSQFINSEALFALQDADVILFLADGSSKPDALDAKLIEAVRQLKTTVPVLLAVNKSDAIDGKTFAANRQLYEALYPFAQVLAISAATGTGLERLLEIVKQNLPEGPEYYPADQVTDAYERDIAAEMIRAACLTNLSDEVPYGVAVRVDEYSQRENGLLYIKATLFVEREAQKGIVIGRNGEMIKRIGSNARVEIERMADQKVFLELSVKVRKDWKNDSAFLQEMGLFNKG